jgi:hypothetical protein
MRLKRRLCRATDGLSRIGRAVRSETAKAAAASTAL